MIVVVALVFIGVSSIRLSFYYEGDFAWLLTIIIIFLVMFRMYSILIVYKFMKSVRLMKSISPRNLKAGEVEMFFKGTFRYFPPPRHFSEVQRAENGAYNMNYEISKDRLNVGKWQETKMFSSA